MYQLRAWKDQQSDSFLVEPFDDLHAAHARQAELRAQGYFSWVWDQTHDLNCSRYLTAPQRA